MIQYSQREFDRMIHIQREVEKLIAQYKDNTEAAHVAFALIRIAKELLAKYPDATRAELTEVVVMTLLDAKEVPAQTIHKPSIFDFLRPQ